MAKKIRTLTVKDIPINITLKNDLDYISLTDMAKGFDGKNIDDWIRLNSTMDFLSVWEEINNPNFNYGEITVIKNRLKKTQGSYKRLSIKQWIAKTNAIGVIAKAGRYGGTYAHKDIAFEFAMWLSAKFKLYVIKDYERLKAKETAETKSLEWEGKRWLAKMNYRVHTDAVKTLIPPELEKHKINHVFASEADLLNVALFGKTAKQWRESNKDKEGNMRDHATIEQLIVLANLESYNAILIGEGVNQLDRLHKLRDAAIAQMKSILGHPSIKRLK